MPRRYQFPSSRDHAANQVNTDQERKAVADPKARIGRPAAMGRVETTFAVTSCVAGDVASDSVSRISGVFPRSPAMSRSRA